MAHLPVNDQLIHDAIVESMPSIEAPPVVRAIYFLMRDGVVVYVGQTEHLYQRMISHTQERTKIFDDMRYLAMPTGNMNIVERELVWRLNPEYNGKNVRGKKPKRTDSINRHILSQTVSMASIRARQVTYSGG